MLGLCTHPLLMQDCLFLALLATLFDFQAHRRNFGSSSKWLTFQGWRKGGLVQVKAVHKLFSTEPTSSGLIHYQFLQL